MYPHNECKEDCDAKPPIVIGLTWPKVIGAFAIPLETIGILAIPTYCGTPIWCC
jgi:hypothetical protein